MTPELPQRFMPCQKTLGDRTCEAQSLEYMRFTEAMAEEMSAVSYEVRPWQTICTLGHTVTHNIQDPIIDPQPNPNLFDPRRSHHKQRPPVPQPGKPREALCYRCAKPFTSNPEFPGARPNYCDDCRPLTPRQYRELMAAKE